MTPLFECCKCCGEGVDPGLHADPEFKGHDVGCITCQNWKRKAE